MRAAALPVALLLVAGLLLAACGGGPTGATRTTARSTATHRAAVAARTVVHTFTAYRADGTPTVASAGTEDGYCWDSSLATSGRTAFRCFSAAGGGAQILDPCFAPPTPHPLTVSCVADPWSRATTLHLTRALPAPVTGEATRPWAIELADGSRCVASTGTVPTVGGVNLAYHCAGGTAAALVQTATSPWTAVSADPDASVLRHTTVLGAWRT